MMICCKLNDRKTHVCTQNKKMDVVPDSMIDKNIQIVHRDCYDLFWKLLQECLLLDFGVHEKMSEKKMKDGIKGRELMQHTSDTILQHKPLVHKYLRNGKYDLEFGCITDDGWSCGAIARFWVEYSALVSSITGHLSRENDKKKFPRPKSALFEDAVKEVAEKCGRDLVVSCFTKLNFSGRKITRIGNRFKSLFGKGANLRELIISRNRLEELCDIPACLTQLYATQNSISRVQNLASLQHLQHIGLGFNRLSNVDFLRDAGHMLISVDLSFNELEDIHHVVDVMSQLPHLQILALMGNVISLNPNYRPFVIRECQSLMILDDIKITEEEREFVMMNEIINAENSATIDLMVQINKLSGLDVVIAEEPIQIDQPQKKSVPRSAGSKKKITALAEEISMDDEPKYVTKTYYYVQLRIPKEILRTVGKHSQLEDMEDEDVFFRTVEKEEAPSIEFEFSVTLHELNLSNELDKFLRTPLELKLMRKTVEQLVDETVETPGLKQKKKKDRQKSRQGGDRGRAAKEEEGSQQLPPPPKERNAREEYVGSGFFDLVNLFNFMTTKVESESKIRNLVTLDEQQQQQQSDMTLSMCVETNPDHHNQWVEFHLQQQQQDYTHTEDVGAGTIKE